MTKLSLSLSSSIVALFVASSACSSTTGPDGRSLSVVPADTGITIGKSYVLRLHLVDQSGNEVARGSYTPSYLLTGSSVQLRGDTVTALSPGSATIDISVPTSSAGVLHAQAKVLVGVVVTDVVPRE